MGGIAEFPADAGFVKEIAAHGLHLRDELVVGEGGFEIDGDGGLRHGAEGGTELIDRAAFEAVAGDHEFADGGLCLRRGRGCFSAACPRRRRGLRAAMRVPSRSWRERADDGRCRAFSKIEVQPPSEPVFAHEPPPRARMTASAVAVLPLANPS